MSLEPATLAGADVRGPARRRHRRIATEEAMAVPELMTAMRGVGRSTWKSLDLNMWRRLANAAPGGSDGGYWPIHQALLDFDAGRIAEMDDAGVDMHVLSLVCP